MIFLGDSICRMCSASLQVRCLVSRGAVASECDPYSLAPWPPPPCHTEQRGPSHPRDGHQGGLAIRISPFQPPCCAVHMCLVPLWLRTVPAFARFRTDAAAALPCNSERRKAAVLVY